MTTGQISGESIRDYHAADAFSASKLKVFRKLPAIYRAAYVDKTITLKGPASSSALDIGNAVDCLLLEGVDAYAKRVYVLPESYRPNAKADKALIAEKTKAGVTVLTQQEAALVEEMCQAVYRHPVASVLLEHGSPAQTFRFDYGFACGQCRPDWLNLEGTSIDGSPTGPYWLELKSAASLHRGDFYGFSDAWVDKQYWLHLPLYRAIITDVLTKEGRSALIPRPLFLVVDKGDIPYCQVFDPLSTDRGRWHFELGTKKIEQDLLRLKKCYETGDWPGLPQGIMPLELPAWKEKQVVAELP